ncbi:MAG: cation-translocating P-type ATPase C-terminal domain-containing protein [Nitrospirota bacterium]
MTDGLPTLALAADSKDPDLMRRPPRPRAERFLTTERFLMLFAQGSFLALITLGSVMYCLYGMDLNVERARTLTFTILVTAHLFHAFNNRSDRRSIVEIGFLTNKPLLGAVALSGLLQAAIVLTPPIHPIFDVVLFDPEHWLLASGIGALPLVAMEIWKAGLVKRRISSSAPDLNGF